MKFDLGDYPSAIEYYTRSIELNSFNAGVYYNRGTARFNSCDHAGAIKDFTRVIQLNPADIQAYILRGFSKYNLGDIKGACADWAVAGTKNCFDACELMQEYCK